MTADRELGTFHELVAELNYPMIVVTTVADGERSGCLVGFSTQCSIDPALFMVFLSDKNHTFRVAVAAGVLAVHFLSTEDQAIAELFGETTGDEIDKFGRCRWHEGPEGVPILDDCPTWFVGRIVDQHPVGGDHHGFLLEPVAAAKRRSIQQMGFQHVKDMEPGHSA
jgi:flavin reductase (DIM6/NTAB) family NADH-FMN oxidoreductase RutF